MASFKQTRPLGRRCLAGFVLAGGFALVGWSVASGLGCSPRALPAPPAIDCTSQNADQVWLLETYDLAGQLYGWYTYGDNTPGAHNSATAVTIEGDAGGPCGARATALLLQAHGYQDYGSGFGTYSIGGYMGIQRPGGQPCFDDAGGDDGGDAGSGFNCQIDGGGWDGLRFWARSFDPTGAPTTKGVTISLNDKDTISNVVGHDCVDYDAGVQGNGGLIYTPVGGGQMGPAGGGVASALPPADACGNGFARVLLTTDQWQLYELPFNSFYQLARPNRVPSGFDPTSFAQITITVPKEASLSLWIDDLGLYRHGMPEAGQ